MKTQSQYACDVTSKVEDHVKFEPASPFFLVYLCQHQNKKNVMSTIMKTMIIFSFLCIFAKYQSKKCIRFDNLNKRKRQNDGERCNTTCSRNFELPCGGPRGRMGKVVVF